MSTSPPPPHGLTYSEYGCGNPEATYRHIQGVFLTEPPLGSLKL